ncbi:cytochrome B5-like protein isoform X2 [Prosopis cineraria]|uniref:cytochrome B5-like protein isoform X2 n=1 Tax=Prosopis cineraria TaxID=364024 RepID=UPI00240F0B9C|nr:cytochrome B5-like protein isoform X2 [Prosopis cineraria]
MMLMVALALVLGFLLSVFVFTPRDRKSSCLGKDKSNLKDNKASKTYSKAEVSLHNKRTDCWIIIKNKVYDVTSYVEEHPGGDAILTHAGDDSTEGFYGFKKPNCIFIGFPRGTLISSRLLPVWCKAATCNSSI